MTVRKGGTRFNARWWVGFLTLIAVVREQLHVEIISPSKQVTKGAPVTFTR
jgi:hypothetical protein